MVVSGKPVERADERPLTGGDLAAMIVHDLKSPLTSILLNARLLSEGAAAPQDGSDIARDILGAAERMLRMLPAMVEAYRNDAALATNQRDAVDLAALVDEVAASMRPRLDLKAQQVVRVRRGASWFALGERDLLRRVLENLLDNSHKYGPVGGTIWVETAETPSGQVMLRVRDEGPGIPESVRRDVFRPYVRGVRGGEPGMPSGFGLGLAFCRAAVEALGGSIHLEHERPRGTCVHVELPAAVAPEAVEREDVAVSAPRTRRDTMPLFRKVDAGAAGPKTRPSPFATRGRDERGLGWGGRPALAAGGRGR